ncbi:MAG: hypothetical protein A2017_03020 [Lentisphaerae bacterium GWF2_44_16]|nr:MAG: hypothetical protein A2017_03020 [Lentisphaerae bacterium GWF2_44_16]
MKLSNTNQRRIIIEELRKLDTHPTADELYIIVREKIPQISLGTVYRNLELLSKKGQILKLELTGKQKRFDGNIENHYHLRCTKCGRVVDIEIDDMLEIDKKLNELVDRLSLDGYRLELSGICEICKTEK